MNIPERENTDLIKEFNRYVHKHPEFAGKIPNNAIVVMQLDGDNKFNRWSLKLGRKIAEKGQPVVCVRRKG